MSRARVGKGDDFMPGTSLQELLVVRKGTRPGKLGDRISAAIMRKQGKSQSDIAECLGYPQPTISNWLRRMNERGLAGMYDRKSPGRPCNLSEEQLEELRQDMLKEPQECGFEVGVWTASLVVTHISEKFTEMYTCDGALKLAHRMGFSVRKSRPVHPKCAYEEAIKQYREDTARRIEECTKEGRKVVCVDASAIENNGSDSRGLRPKGGRETTKVNFSRDSMKMYGAIGDGVREIHFCDKADSDGLIELIDKVRQQDDKLLVILDNASPHKSKKTQEYVEASGGDVVLWYTPPYTPQENPIEILWREIKRAAGRYYEGGFEEMAESILRMIKNHEVCVPLLYEYMRDAIRRARDALAEQAAH